MLMISICLRCVTHYVQVLSPTRLLIFQYPTTAGSSQCPNRWFWMCWITQQHTHECTEDHMYVMCSVQDQDSFVWREVYTTPIAESASIHNTLGQIDGNYAGWICWKHPLKIILRHNLARFGPGHSTGTWLMTTHLGNWEMVLLSSLWLRWVND